MFSKQLKEFDVDNKPEWLNTIIYGLQSIYSKLIGQYIYYIKKLYGWHSNVFKYDFDFDAHSIFSILEYKLRRVRDVLEDGHAIQENQDMKALNLAIKLAVRLRDDDYDDSFHARHDVKWGEMTHWFEPVEDGSGSSYWKNSRPLANTDEEKEQEIADFRKIYVLSQKKRDRETRWFYDILRIYLNKWWD